jgi:hypothetical protein
MLFEFKLASQLTKVEARVKLSPKKILKKIKPG